MRGQACTTSGDPTGGRDATQRSVPHCLLPACILKVQPALGSCMLFPLAPCKQPRVHCMLVDNPPPRLQRPTCTQPHAPTCMPSRPPTHHMHQGAAGCGMHPPPPAPQLITCIHPPSPPSTMSAARASRWGSCSTHHPMSNVHHLTTPPGVSPTQHNPNPPPHIVHPPCRQPEHPVRGRPAPQPACPAALLAALHLLLLPTQALALALVSALAPPAAACRVGRVGDGGWGGQR